MKAAALMMILRATGKGGANNAAVSNLRTLGGGVRHFVLKSSDRAAVHGAKLPQVDLLDKEEVQTEIEKARQEKEKQRKKIEEAVDSHLNNSNPHILLTPDSSSNVPPRE